MGQNTTQVQPYAVQDGYFGVTNLGGFVAIIYASYMLNGEQQNMNSDIFTLFLYREINIPANATDIHLYALIKDGLGQWTPVYNNNLLTSGIVQLQLYGTIWSPQASIVRDPNPTTLRVLATNNGAFVARYSMSYTFDGLVYEMESQNFPVGVSRKIDIPVSSTNILVKADFLSGTSWVNFYSNTFAKTVNIDLVFSGTIISPNCDETTSTPPSSGTGVAKKQAQIISAKKTHKNTSNLGDTVTFSINISNPTSTTANSVVLTETVPAELQFIPNSLKINGINFDDVDLSSSTLNLGNIQMYSSVLVTYQVKVVSTPSTNKIMYPPNFTFSYLDESNQVQNSSSTGSVLPLFVGAKPTNPCCCCCCPCTCQPTT